VPASTSTSSSSKKDVVLQSFAMAPEQPSTLTFIDLARPVSFVMTLNNLTLFGLEVGCAIPFWIKWQQTHRGYTFCVQLVKVFFGIHAL